MGLPEWELAKETLRLWLRDTAAALPKLGPPEWWLARLRRTGHFSLRLARRVVQGLGDMFLVHLYSMYLAVLADRMAASRMSLLVSSPALRGSPQGDGAAHAPRGSVQGHVGMALARLRPQLGDRFLMDYCPRPL